MLTAVGVKVLDFGIATRLGGSDPLPVMATPPYGSPEQLAGHPVDARTDIFSFGAVAYEMITGRRAFHGDTRGSACRQRPPGRAPCRCAISFRPFPNRWRERCRGVWRRRLMSAGRRRTICSSSCVPSPRRRMDPAVTDRPIRMRSWIERAVWAVALVTALILYAFARTEPAQVAESPAPDLRFELVAGARYVVCLRLRCAIRTRSRRAQPCVRRSRARRASSDCGFGRSMRPPAEPSKSRAPRTPTLPSGRPTARGSASSVATDSSRCACRIVASTPSRRVSRRWPARPGTPTASSSSRAAQADSRGSRPRVVPWLR